MGTSAEQLFGQLTAIEQTQEVSRLNSMVAVHVKEAVGLQRRAICRHPRNRLRSERIQEAKQFRGVILVHVTVVVDIARQNRIVPGRFRQARWHFTRCRSQGVDHEEQVKRLNDAVPVDVEERPRPNSGREGVRNRLRSVRVQEANQLRSVVLGDLAISVDIAWERPIVPPLLSLLRRPHSGREDFQVSSDSAD